MIKSENYERSWRAADFIMYLRRILLPISNMHTSESQRDYRELPSPDEAKSKEKAKKRPANDNVII